MIVIVIESDLPEPSCAAAVIVALCPLLPCAVTATLFPFGTMDKIDDNIVKSEAYFKYGLFKDDENKTQDANQQKQPEKLANNKGAATHASFGGAESVANMATGAGATEDAAAVDAGNIDIAEDQEGGDDAELVALAENVQNITGDELVSENGKVDVDALKDAIANLNDEDIISVTDQDPDKLEKFNLV